ncbi:hypothetical protein GpartN1_g369.t1 [Galdieria partita]|uniref:Uncharacterized protein n=1 Tax=Galdieria partita TaxID=83374 RepID=A0A9C7PQ86_9RHOD|nr:hypothetical protein GpartN1_g369.t1 [Galdieria partita]
MAYISVPNLFETKNTKRIHNIRNCKPCFYRCLFSNVRTISSKRNAAGPYKKRSTRRKKEKENTNGENKKTRFSVQWANVHLSPEEIGKKYVIAQAVDSETSKVPRQSQEWKNLISKLDLKQLEKWKQGGSVPEKWEFLNKVRRSSILSDEEIQTRRVTGKEFVTDKENELVKTVRERLKEQERKYVPTEELLIGSIVTKSPERGSCSNFPCEYEFAVIVNQPQVIEKLKQLVENILKRSVSERDVVSNKFGFQYRVGIRTKVYSLEEIKKVYAAMHENENVAFSFG